LSPDDQYTAAEAQVADKSVADLVNQISEQASTLVREEIELAKAEMAIKARRLGVGAGVGAAAGFFVFLALIYAFEGLAWFLNDEVFDSLWLGFVVVMALLLLLGALAGFIAYRMIQAGAPPTPDLAIEEAKLTKEALEHPGAVPAPDGPSGTPSNNRS
jgi:Putative Actinobacterial Holin-X, holin superfamily III